MEIILLFIIVLGGGITLLYNQLVKLRNNREQALSDIDVQTKLRYDLIPNLVETVKGYATHEKEVLERVTALRTQAMQGGSLESRAGTETMLSGALHSLFAVAENYPDLKANQNFLQLQQELSDIEDKIAAARRFFNNATKELNTAIQSFPANILAGIFGFKREAFFDLGDEKEAASQPTSISL